MKKNLYYALVAMCFAVVASCNSAQEAQDDIIASRSMEKLTTAEANAMVSRLQENNTYIDYDSDSLGIVSLSRDEITPLQVSCRVSLYRFYSGVIKVDNRYRQSKTASELNIAPHIFDYYMEHILEKNNAFMDEIDARRKNGEEVNVFMTDLTDKESNEQIIRF